MSKTVHSVKLQAYDSVDLDRVSYNNGDLVYDYTNNTLRIMNGVVSGGSKIATQNWVLANALTNSALNSAISSQLANYVTTTTLSSYVTSTQLTTALSTVASAYTLPIAGTGSGGTLGGIRVDGSTITVDSNGVISGANTYVLPTAQAATGGNVLGGVIPDGVTITINPSTGVITGAQLYTLPAATSSVLGGVRVPVVGTSGLTNTLGTIGLATASTTQLGGVIVDGSSITINSGTISATPYTLPAATSSSLGGVIVGSTIVSGLINTGGSIKLATASISQLGAVKVDGSNGVITANLPSAITFAGTWSAALNSPLLQNGTGTNGYEYVCNASGTVNFGAGNIAFSVGDIVIYTAGVWTRIPASSSSGTTNNAITFTNTGGNATGTTFNGSTAVTIDYSTLGASPLAGSSSLVTVGTIATGVWNGTLISPTYGGTGVNNGSATLTLAGNVTFAGAYATSITSTASTSVTMPTSGYLISSVSALPGAVTGTPSSTTYLRGDGQWAAVSAGGGGTVTSVSGAGTVSGLTLTGTVTSSGALTLGGTLDLSAPPAIGSATPNTGRFTTITSTQSTGTAPFTVSSSTLVTNLNANYLNGATFASPGAIGGSAAAQVNSTNLVITTGNIYNQQPNPTALTASTTITIAQILTNIVTVTSTTAVTLTLPAGSSVDAGVLSGALPTNGCFDWNVINLGSSSGAVTMAAGTSHTYTGSTTVAVGTSAGFRTRKLGANSYATYRIH